MASKICTKCKTEKTIANYIAVNSIFHNGSLPICRDCINSIIDKAPDDEKWNIVNKLCQWADIPFVPSEWAKFAATNGKNAFGMYAAVFRQEPYSDFDWSDYNQAYIELQESNHLEDAIPELKEKQLKDLRKKWGIHYEEEQLEYLESLHAGLINSQNVVGALNEDQALKLCKISLIIEEKIRGGLDFTKDLKAYDELAKLSNLTPKNVKEANEFDSFGEVFAYLEKTGWTNKYYDGAIRDEVDNTEKNIKNWLRYLYVNETGIAEEIEQRINNLKISAELEGESFNENEFRDYMSEESNIIQSEEFEIDI